MTDMGNPITGTLADLHAKMATCTCGYCAWVRRVERRTFTTIDDLNALAQKAADVAAAAAGAWTFPGPHRVRIAKLSGDQDITVHGGSKQ